MVLLAAGDDAELHQEDPGGVDGVTEGVLGLEEAEVVTRGSWPPSQPPLSQK